MLRAMLIVCLLSSHLVHLVYVNVKKCPFCHMGRLFHQDIVSTKTGLEKKRRDLLWF